MNNAGIFFFYSVFGPIFFIFSWQLKKKESQKLGSGHRAMRKKLVHIFMRTGL